MISLLHSAEVCALFPTRLDRLRLVSRTTWYLRRRMTKTQSFRSASTLRSGRPVHLLSPTSASLPCKSSQDLINYARAHNGLWLHMEVSSMNNLMIPLSLGGGPKEKQASPGILRCLNPPRCVFRLPPQIIHQLTISHLSWISLTQSTSTSIAWHNKQTQK